jgi:hypothetical protein
MQIHELNSYTGALDDAYTIVDNGLDTGKISIPTVLEDVNDAIDTMESRLDTAIAGLTVDSEVIDIRVGADGVTYPTAGDAVRGQITNVEDKIDSLVENVYSKNRYTGIYEAGYVNQVSGEWSAGSPTYAGTPDYLSLPGSPFLFEFYNIGTSISLGFRYAIYDANKNYISGALVDNTSFTFITNPDDPTALVGYYEVNNPNAKYVRFSCLAGIMSNANVGIQVAIESTPTGYKAYTGDKTLIDPSLLPELSELDNIKSSVIGKGSMSATASALASNEELEIDVDCSVRKNKVYHLHTLIDQSFDTLYFGHGQGSYSLYFKLDNSNITFMTNGSEGTTLAHGLTLDTYVDIMLIVGEKSTGELIINTLGGIYTREVSIVNGYKGKVFVKPSGCSLTNVAIDFTSTDFRQPIWMFGDSYFTHTSTDRWPYYLVEWGFGRCLLNAFPGENSSEALPQAQAYIPDCGTPSYAVWCLGMNDPDSSSAINSTWKTKVEAFISLCEANGIIPVLATIPNVPSYSNYYKNLYVKASGYRYIDFAKAVGAESVGSSWYPGALSNDNTHPTSIGARLLCLQAIHDLPELTLGNI